jgi:SRSO17 transposase
LGTITDYFQLQHFFTESNWHAQNVIDLVAKQTSNALPQKKLTGQIIEETGTVKKGKKVSELAGTTSAMLVKLPIARFV